MKKKNNEKKQEIIIARCTKFEKDKIKRKAESIGKSESRFILDCAIAGTERKSDKDKKRLASLIELQESINQLSYMIKDGSSRSEPDINEQLMTHIIEMERKIRCLC